MKDFGGGECENKIVSIKKVILDHEILPTQSPDI